MTTGDVEESRLALAEVELHGLLKHGEWYSAISGVGDASITGRALWQDESNPDQMDDRRLYWRRLALKRTMRAAGWTDEDLKAFEYASRGLQDLEFDPVADYRIVVTGFDPFHLDTDISQSNPSGVAALQLNGRMIELGDGLAEIKTIIVPVRFEDFDQGLIEDFFGPLLRQDKLDMIVTVSMGRDAFDLERFPGRRRSVETYDNRRRHGGGTAVSPFVPESLPGPEFVEFSLPVSAIQSAVGQFAVNDNTGVATLEKGAFEAMDLEALRDQTAVLGSGGGFLSNEISYRLVRLVQEIGKSVPVGHIHTPKLKGYDVNLIRPITMQAVSMIEAAVKTLA